MARLDGNVALVTGAARGIGRAIATVLAEEGADVAIVDVDATTMALDLVKAAEGLGRKSLLVDADVSKVDHCYRMVKRTVEHFGHLDLLVNNAAQSGYQPFDEITEADFDRVVDTNLKGTFFACQAAVPHMRAQGHGKIVNIGSEQMYIGYALLTHYTASKGGIASFGRSLALALAPTILVNTVAPGPTMTEKMRAGPENVPEVIDKIPLKRFGEPREVARTVAFLASSDGDVFTGQIFDPNVGTVMP